MLHDELLCFYKSAPIEISAEGICEIGSINSCDNHSDKTSLLKVKAIL